MRAVIFLLSLLPCGLTLASAELLETPFGSEALLPGFTQTRFLSGEFRQQRTIEVLKLPLISSGTFLYRHDRGILWQTITPVQNIVQIDNQKGLLAGTNANDLNPVSTPQLIADLFLGVFSGNFEQLATHFTIDNVAAGEGWQLHLTPRSQALQSHLMYIELQGDKHIEFIVFEEANGDRTQIHLFNISSE